MDEANGVLQEGKIGDMARDVEADGVPQEAVMDQVAFLGETLGPLFLEDPGRDGASTPAALAAFAALDVRAAAQEWPFAQIAQGVWDTQGARGVQAAQGAQGARDVWGVQGARSTRGVQAAQGAQSTQDVRGVSEVEVALELMHTGALAGADDALVWEYRRLFVGPAAKVAPPWGSVYTDRESVVFGESTLELRAWMRVHGIKRMGGEADPEDHIGLMLLLMAWIADNRPELLDEYLQLHLLTWADHFLEGVVKSTKHAFYEGLARLSRASLEGLRLARGLQVAYPRFYR